MGVAERKEREKLKKMNDIVDAAERVFFSKGYDTAKMDDVAEEAEYSKGTLYLYFKSKEELYLKIVSRAEKTLYDLFENAIIDEPDGLCKVRAIGEAFMKFYVEHPDYHSALMFDQAKEINAKEIQIHESVHENMKKHANELLVDALQTGIEDGSIRSDINPPVIAMILWGETLGVMQLVKQKGALIEHMFKHDPEEVIKEFFDFTFRALKSDKL
jgi:AcrR family transcriptional regulator